VLKVISSEHAAAGIEWPLVLGVISRLVCALRCLMMPGKLIQAAMLALPLTIDLQLIRRLWLQTAAASAGSGGLFVRLDQ